MYSYKQHSSKGFPPSQEGLPKLWVRNKTVSLESVPISYLTMQRMSLSLLWPFPSHILRPPFPSRIVIDLTVSTPRPPPLQKKEKRGVCGSSLVEIAFPPPSLGLWNRPNLLPPCGARDFSYCTSEVLKLYFKLSDWLIDWTKALAIINKNDYKWQNW